MAKKTQKLPSASAQYDLFDHLVRIISSTNGISLQETLELATNSAAIKKKRQAYALLLDFRQHLSQFQQYAEDVDVLLNHPVGHTLYEFLRKFPIPYQDEHMHLTGSLTPDFIYAELQPLLVGKQAALYKQKIEEVYGKGSLPKSAEDVEKLIVMPEGEGFSRYLEILFLPKLFLKDRGAHRRAAWHMAQEMNEKYNVGSIRLKFTLSRVSPMKAEQVPGVEYLTPEDVMLGLYEGFMDFKKDHPSFGFVLSPSFRKEEDFYDHKRFSSKKEDFMSQVDSILQLLETYPELQRYVTDVDTVGEDRHLYRKIHFFPMQPGFHKLHQYGLKVRSHHGENWHTLNHGIQSVDNAMNIWHIDTLEHGLSLGINPNYYFHQIFENVRALNIKGVEVNRESEEGKELIEMDWGDNEHILKKITTGKHLTAADVTRFARIKSLHAMEVEYYQHDVLNHMIDKGVGLTALPSSNKKLSGRIADYKNHPFSWWEKKGVDEGIGTDNYVTLGTNFLRELIVLMLADPKNLKITKLLLVATNETRRPYLSKNLWDMRKQLKKEFA